jgi:hypothetical protein
MRYTLRTAPAILARETVQDYCDDQRRLESAIRKLVG